MNTDALAKAIFITTSTLTALGLALVFGMWSGHHKTALFKWVEATWINIKASGEAIEQTSLLRPDYLLQPARYPGEGVTINTLTNNDELILLSGFFKEEDTNELRLIRRDGTLVNRWPLHYSKIFPHPDHVRQTPASDWNTDVHGMVIHPDGSVVFNFEYAGLVKLDRCGNTIWTLPHETHHSVEMAEGGGYWVLGQRYVENIPDAQTPYPPFLPPFRDSKILKVSENGTIVNEISIPELFYRNNMDAVLTSAPYYYYGRSSLKSYAKEIVHPNKIAELSSALAGAFPMFAAGDLLLSIRSLNLVMVVDPDTKVVKWWRVGPWKRQHDPEFTASGKIQVFNNNAHIIFAYDPFGGDEQLFRTSLETPRVSNIIEYDPRTDSATIRYGYGGKPGQELLSVIRGKVDPTPSGGILITENDGGRAFQIDAEGNIVWQYINRYDDDEVAELTEARVYDKDYFTVSDWSCQ